MRTATLKLAFIVPAACLGAALVACGGSSSRSVASTPPRPVAVSQTRTTSAPLVTPAQPASDPAADRERERARITALAAECESESGGAHSRSARAQKRATSPAPAATTASADVAKGADAARDGGAGVTEPASTALDTAATTANQGNTSKSEVELLDQECANAAMTVAAYALEAPSVREDFVAAADAGH